MVPKYFNTTLVPKINIYNIVSRHLKIKQKLTYIWNQL